MKATATPTQPSATSTPSKPAKLGRIHPIIIYPFHPPRKYEDLESLYEWVSGLQRASRTYQRPITVMDRKTDFALRTSPEFLEFKKVVTKHSEVLDVWCVDTCQMWYSGLGTAFERGAENDVYWLIPGDFNYGDNLGLEVLNRLHDLPEIVGELQQDLCIGEIATDHSNSKQLIDTYGTFALLYNWFPEEAQEIRQFTERPRSEFFAVRHGFLRELLCQRWYAYEQTVVMLLSAVFSKRRISRFFVGNISDLPEGRESLSSALQQVERTERVLKSVWRERHQDAPNWISEYRGLEKQSDQIRRTALTIMQTLLQ